MPIFKVGCECGYRGEKYLHHEFHRNSLHSCPAGVVDSDGNKNRHNACGKILTFMPSYGVPMTYFRENSSRVIYNIGPDPITITSPEHHKKEMDKHGVALAGSKRGMPGAWA